MPDGQVVFEITGDNKPVMQAVSDTTRDIDRETKKWDKAAGDAAGGMENSMVSMFKKISVAAVGAKVGQVLVQWGSAAIEAASDLQEVQNVVDVTFGDSAAQIDAWSKNAINQFGLTETQAKRFTSTLGAMMKSSSIEGGQIVKMSEDLAGLAADMASFYNLDFETAFQKIRSGISGETEPLKQLGINLSVANLEAYALTQGITKSFQQMSQGEQTLLRYQYLMQATADAQGDFARTSDGFANAQRIIESNLASIQTSIGTMLLPVVQEATTEVAKLLQTLNAKPETTVLDTFESIDIDTQGKLKEIQDTAEQARLLTESLKNLGNTNAGAAMESLANGANKLNAGTPGTWESLLGALQSIDGLENIFSNNQAGQNVEDLAQALSGNSPDTSKAEAWQTFLGALSGNTDALSALTGESAEETAAWLETMAVAANAIEPEDAEAWNKLLSNFVTGLPGLKDTEAGKAFFEAMAQNFLAMGTESEEAKSGLAALGFSTDEISEKQRIWLAVCKQLVSTIPGLSSIINTQTGEVKGGTAAIEEYVKSWNDLMSRDILIAAVQQKKDALAAEFSDLPELAAKAAPAAVKMKEARKALADALNGREYNPYSMHVYEDQDQLNALYNAAKEAEAAYLEAYAPYQRRKEAYDQALILLTDQEQALKELGITADDTADSVDDAAGSLTKLQDAAQNGGDSLKEIQAALKNTEDALKAIADYQDKVYQETAQSVARVVNGFAEVKTPAQQAREKMKDLTDQIDKMNDAAKRGELSKTYSDIENSLPSVQNMTMALQSQLEYMKAYQKELDLARANGVSEGILGMLSDGSQESFDYLYALNHTGGDIEQLNKAYADVQTEAGKFTNTLTTQKLTADETFKGIVDSAAEAVAGLNQYDGAKASIEATVKGIVDGLADQKSKVTEQVNAILAQISRLNNAGGFGFTSRMLFNFSFGSGGKSGGSQANGLDNVPYDGYLAFLHQGERVQTAAEAALSRRYSLGQNQGFDYEAMGSAFRDNLPKGIPIVWRGREVAEILSEMQGDSYRALERSGWKS